MTSSTFAIVNLQGGQQRDRESFLLDNDAFPIIENAYLFRGRIERRSATVAVGVDGRLKGEIGTTDAGGALTIGPIVAGAPVGITINVGISQFVIAGDTLTDRGTVSPTTLLTTGAVTGTLDRATGILSTSALNTSVTFIPGLPVMGLWLLEQEAINDELLFAFDTVWTYLFNRGLNDFEFENQFRSSGTGDTFIWTGSNSDFIWGYNYFKAFWATNNTPGFHASEDSSPIAEGDGIRWYSDDPGGTGWNNFNPPITSTEFLNGCLCIVAYKGRLLCFNTLEGINLAGTTRFAQRVRWSQIGTPFYNNAPNGVTGVIDSWRSDIVGKGGFIDAPTSEAIVSVEFIKDTLIVYFERSTWQLVYTSNETLPFYFQKINTELGCESTFSVVPFDSGVLAVGNVGITACDSVSVTRIDQKIPDEVFRIQNKNNGVSRVHGVRDYNAQLAYWTYPVLSEYDDDAPNYDLIFPNQLIVYNYLNGSWSQFDDCFTCFGYFQKLTDITWAQLPYAWETQPVAWNNGVLQSRYPDVVAGNQLGYVGIFSQIQQVGLNMIAFHISDVTNATASLFVPNHNLVNNDYIYVVNAPGLTGIVGSIFSVKVTDANNFILNSDALGTIPIITGTYLGNGTFIYLPNIYVKTKEFNPYYQEGKSCRFTYIDLFADRTARGQFTTEFYTSDGDYTLPSPLTVATTPETNGQLQQDKIWHRVHTDSYGSFIQMIFTMSDAQMRDLSITTSDITIHGLVVYLSPTGRLAYEF